MKKILSIHNLSVFYLKNQEKIFILKNINFHIEKGKIVGLVGESGSGKSMLSKALLRLLPENLSFHADSILFDDHDLNTLSTADFRKLLGNKISIIFQDPMTAMNPLLRVGNQLDESLKLHTKLNKQERRGKIEHMLSKVGIDSPQSVYNMYPHELSGGMKQRVLIAQALLNDPHLLIADEPTTAIDATTQAQILKLLLTLQNDLQLSILFISHDLHVIHKFTDFTWVLYAGQLMESGPSSEVFKNPHHPYTRGLIDANTSVLHKTAPVPIPGTVPSPGEKGKGCPFASRCLYVKDICRNEDLPEKRVSNGFVFCHFPLGYEKKG